METFVVRVWTSEPHESAVPDHALRGVVRNVRTGLETPFVSWEELRGILAEPLATGSARTSAPVRGEGEAR
jgi:hypothetical protein